MHIHKFPVIFLLSFVLIETHNNEPCLHMTHEHITHCRLIPVGVVIRQRVGMKLLGIKKKVLSTWMMLQAVRKRKADWRETPTSCNNCRRKQEQVEVIMRMWIFTFYSWEQRVDVSHLDDKKQGWGRVKGPVIESDDGGTVWAEQVSNLQEGNSHQSRQMNVVSLSVWLRLSLCNPSLVILCHVTNILPDWLWRCDLWVAASLWINKLQSLVWEKPCTSYISCTIYNTYKQLSLGAEASCLLLLETLWSGEHEDLKDHEVKHWLLQFCF